MTDATRLDAAAAAMAQAPQNDALRLRFYDRLSEAELFLLLEAPAGEEGTLRPQLFALESGPVALAFDREERLTAFTGAAAEYAALSGRRLAARLAGQGIGLGLNLGAPSETLLPPDALDWLAQTLAHRPQEESARAETLSPPGALPEALLTALDAKLASAAGLARLAYLAGVRYAGGARGHLLAFVDPAPGAEQALATAAGEALAFSGLEAGALDVAFFRSADPVAARLARVGLRIDLPAPPEAAAPAAPGSDPARPPRLR